MQAVIMAGGKGTRLQALTRGRIPKPMVPVAGKPILAWQIERLREQGIGDIVLVVGCLGEKIRAYFRDGSDFGVRIRYVREEQPLGTAGALALLAPMLTDETFFLVFGDILFDVDLARMAAFHRAKGAEATLFVHPNSHPFDSDLVVCGESGLVTGFDFKSNVRDYWYGNCVNAGLYLLNAGVCGRVPEAVKTDLERDLLAGMIAGDAAVYAYRSPEYVRDVGTVERLTAAERDLAEGLPQRRNLARSQRAIFLDRDGTLNRENGLIYREDQFELESCAAEAVRAVNASGYLAIVITNQPVVARGLCAIEDVENIHRKMQTLLGREGAYLDDIRFCPHHPDRGYPGENPAYKIPCRCRKPDIGLIERCVRRYNIDPALSWMVGDTTRDIQTGKNAGMGTALVMTGAAGRDGLYGARADLECRDLLHAVREIIQGGS